MINQTNSKLFKVKFARLIFTKILNALCSSGQFKCSLPHLRHEQSNRLNLSMYSVLFYSLSYLEISFNEIFFPDIPEGRKRGINVKFQRINYSM